MVPALKVTIGIVVYQRTRQGTDIGVVHVGIEIAYQHYLASYKITQLIGGILLQQLGAHIWKGHLEVIEIARPCIGRNLHKLHITT